VTDLARAVAAFVAVDIDAFPGLPAELRPEDLQPLLEFDPDDRRRGDAGDPSSSRLWIPAETTRYRGGLRLWLDSDGERVALLEGVNPLDPEDEPVPAPDLGEPDETLAAVLGPFHVPDAERVYAGRGLAVQVYPDTGVLVGVLGFAATTFDDYRRRLQPHRQPTRPFNQGVTP
jgi:hypothetical protein